MLAWTFAQAWHPTCKDLVFFTTGARVLAVHVSELAASEQQVQLSQQCLLSSLQYHSTVGIIVRQIVASGPTQRPLSRTIRRKQRCGCEHDYPALSFSLAQVDVDVNALPEGLVCLPLGGPATMLTSIAMAPDGSLLAVGDSSGTVRSLFLLQLRCSTPPWERSERRSYGAFAITSALAACGDASACAGAHVAAAGSERRHKEQRRAGWLGHCAPAVRCCVSGRGHR